MKSYKIVSLTKPGQANVNTKFNPKTILTSKYGPLAAAKKGVSLSCRKSFKKIKGQCTCTITIAEVIVRGNQMIPVLDSQGIPFRYRYTLKRVKNEKEIEFNGKVVPFKYQIKTVENLGRVL